MKQDNRGFTLVELIIGIAILGIVSVAVLGFMASGGRSFKRATTEVNLQFESQTVVNQLNDLLIEANDIKVFGSGIGTTLEIYQKDNRGIVITHISTTNELEYSDGTIEDGIITGLGDSVLFAQYVTEFKVEKLIDSSIVKLELVFTLDGRSYTANKTVTMRSN